MQVNTVNYSNVQKCISLYWPQGAYIPNYRHKTKMLAHLLPVNKFTCRMSSQMLFNLPKIGFDDIIINGSLIFFNISLQPFVHYIPGYIRCREFVNISTSCGLCSTQTTWDWWNPLKKAYMLYWIKRSTPKANSSSSSQLEQWPPSLSSDYPTVRPLLSKFN